MTSPEHVAFVKAALRDVLGSAVDDETLQRAAEVARSSTLTWLMAAAAEGRVDAHVCDGVCDHG